MAKPNQRDTGVFFWKAKDGWRWRAKALNGQIVAESGEGYARRADCEDGASKAAGWLSEWFWCRPRSAEYL